MFSPEENEVKGENKPDGITDYKRPSWDEYFLQIMQAIAKRGTCERGRSGCVIAKDKQLVSAGYVGSPVGEDHCDDVGHLWQKRYDAEGKYSLHCVRTVHAEQNAICQAAKRGVSIDGATLYCQMTPCPVCAKMIINCGIKRVVCLKRYHDGAEAERLFLKAGVALEHISEEEENYEGKGSHANETEWRPAPLEKAGKVTGDAGVAVKIKKMSPEAILPSYANESDAGLDLNAAEEIEIPAGSRAKIATNLAFEIPGGHVGLIWDRSGLSSKKGLKVMGGVIDSNYRGEVFVIMANVSRESVTIKKNEKVAQMLIQKIEHAKIITTSELTESERGERGFGSSDYPVKQVLEEIDYLPEENEEYDEEIIESEDLDEIQSRW